MVFLPYSRFLPRDGWPLVFSDHHSRCALPLRPYSDQELFGLLAYVWLFFNCIQSSVKWPMSLWNAHLLLEFRRFEDPALIR